MQGSRCSHDHRLQNSRNDDGASAPEQLEPKAGTQSPMIGHGVGALTIEDQTESGPMQRCRRRLKLPRR
jgi:hypothetical protein